MSDSESSETNLIIITKRDRFKLFCKLYWRILIITTTLLLLLPITFYGSNNAYKCLYVFLVTAVYWATDVMHPSVVALIPVALSSVISRGIIGEIYVRNELLDCAGIMIIIVAIEQSNAHRRAALKLLLIFGCSHFRISFLLFFLTMFLAMWISSIIACGLMMPLVKAILIELEQMGILEMYQNIGKAKQQSNKHGESIPRPTDYTVFYFLGVAYSSTIGGVTTLIGSQTNQILTVYCEMFFPNSPKIDFPQFMLLNLPGVLVLETILYLWMNFYFLGLFRVQSEVSIGMTEEEAEYIQTHLRSQYEHMGPVTVHECFVIATVLLTALLQPLISSARIEDITPGHLHFHFKVSSPCMICAVALFVMPRDLSFIKFFKKQSATNPEPLPQSPSEGCVTWALVRNQVNWSVLFIIGGSAAMFEALRDSKTTDELEKFMLLFGNLPWSAVMLIVTLLCKVLAEFAPSSVVAYCLLPHIARMASTCGLNPLYMMTAATMACSLSFHLTAGSPSNAMVAAYVHIPPWKMMSAGFGLSLATVAVSWFTVAAWAGAVWSEPNREPVWAHTNLFYKPI